MTNRPIIPWIGGKRRLAKRILPLIPSHTCYVEPFCGAAAIFFLKPPSDAEVINDINGELVNLYRVVKCHLEELVRQFKWALSSRKIFEWHQMTEPETLTDIQRAARFYFLQKMAFGGRVDGQSFGTSTTSPPRFNLLRLEEDFSQAHMRLARCTIEHLSWQNCMERYDRPGTLFFCDPPYWETEGYGVPFGIEQYERLAEMALSELKGKVIITLNDHPDIRLIFRGMEMERVAINYTIGGGDQAVKRHELIMRNWG